MEQRDAITVRFPVGILDRAREARQGRESLNDLVVGAVERELRRREGWRAIEEIRQIRDGIEKRTGRQAESAPLIRALREGIGRRD